MSTVIVYVSVAPAAISFLSNPQISTADFSTSFSTSYSVYSDWKYICTVCLAARSPSFLTLTVTVKSFSFSRTSNPEYVKSTYDSP